MLLVIFSCGISEADTIYLKNGEVIEGDIVHKSEEMIRVKKQVENKFFTVVELPVSEIEKIEKTKTKLELPEVRQKIAEEARKRKRAAILKASFEDHSAKILNIQGGVNILKEGAQDWRPLTREDTIQKGDFVRTREDSYVEIYYDESHYNVAKIDQNTIAEFRSIEPTDIYVSYGRVFSALDAMPDGAVYEVATPTSVASLRGTQFARVHDASNHETSTFVIHGKIKHLTLDAEGNIVDSRMVEAGHVFVLSIDEIESGALPMTRPMTTDERNTITREAMTIQTHVEMYIREPETAVEMAAVDSYVET